MIQVEQTPNPESLKFLSEKIVSTAGTVEFQKNKSDKIDNDFVRELFSYEGVELVLFSTNFISVKKDKKANWNELKPMIISLMNDYYQKNNTPILTSKKKEENQENQEDGDEIIQKIKEVLDTKIRPAVARDGGDIKFKSFSNGVVKVELQGSCSGCPSSLMTLKQGVQNLLKHYIKEVESVEAI